VVIPALNERESLPRVLGDLPWDLLREVVVVDNGSTDGTAEAAREGGARVVIEPQRGYGRACLTGIAALDATDVVVFLDADYSDRPEELPAVVAPILEGRADMVIGSRVLGEREPGALLPQARFGNLLSVTLIRSLCGARYTDLGPFRAIRRGALDALQMRDEDFGWTVEMQVKAARAGLRVVEVPVRYRRRIGRSKITGTVRGTVLAGWKILVTIARHHRWRPGSGHSSGVSGWAGTMPPP
jgi:glycosyltransferase involved in cell wall biosynthesis